MNVTELAERIAAEHGLGEAPARRIVESVLAAIADAVSSGEDVALSGFGRFKITERAARQGRNPRTGETINVEASRRLAFAAARSVRELLNAAKGYGFIQPETGGPDVFVHVSAVQQAGLNGLDDGQLIGFDVEPDRRGKTSATNLKTV